MSARLREIIVEATGTDRADLEVHVDLIRRNAWPPHWPKPRAVARQAEELARRLPKITRDLRRFDIDALRNPPHRLEDAGAIREAADSLDRALRVLKRVHTEAEAFAEAVMEYEESKQDASRDRRPDNIALAAAFVFHDLTGREPTWWNDSELGPLGAYPFMVEELFAHFGITKGTEGPIRRALVDFKKSA